MKPILGEVHFGETPFWKIQFVEIRLVKSNLVKSLVFPGLTHTDDMFACEVSLSSCKHCVFPPVTAATRGSKIHRSVKAKLKLVETEPASVAEDSRPDLYIGFRFMCSLCGRLQSIKVLCEMLEAGNMQPDTERTTVERAYEC